jgi:hypothetical protein
MKRNAWIALISLISGILFSILVVRHGNAQANNYPRTPTIVKQLRRNNLTNGFQATLFTPPADGLFRISAYVDPVSPGTNTQGVLCENITWTDDYSVPQNWNSMEVSEFGAAVFSCMPTSTNAFSPMPHLQRSYTQKRIHQYP